MRKAPTFKAQDVGHTSIQSAAPAIHELMGGRQQILQHGDDIIQVVEDVGDDGVGVFSDIQHSGCS